MDEKRKTFSQLSKEERLSLVQRLQASRCMLREMSKGRKTGKKRERKKEKTFQFENPAMQAMFDLLPSDFKKKFGKKG